jgi:hypothetical protein
MHKTLRCPIIATAIGVGVLASGLFSAAFPAQRGFHCTLTYKGEMVLARATFMPNEDETEMHYMLEVRNLEDITMAHVHLGMTHHLTTPVVWLYPSSPPPKLVPGPFTGILSEGTITADSLVGPLRGHPLSDLIEEMRAGRAHVNVHTRRHPEGSICGEVRLLE